MHQTKLFSSPFEICFSQDLPWISKNIVIVIIKIMKNSLQKAKHSFLQTILKRTLSVLNCR
jgi:hypothetical protein